MDRMHTGMKGDMDMNATDLAALRMLIMREQRGESVSPHELAEHLRISTASTTKLLDRLTLSGHLERKPHPRDRRARVVVLTQASRDEFYQHFSARLRAMRGVTERYVERRAQGRHPVPGRSERRDRSAGLALQVSVRAAKVPVAKQKKKAPLSGRLLLFVAGTGFEPATSGL